MHISLQKGYNQFLAGDAIRSSQRFKALDETAVVGVVCHHEFPRMFFFSSAWRTLSDKIPYINMI